MISACIVWVTSLISHITGRTRIVDEREQGAEETVGTYEWRNYVVSGFLVCALSPPWLEWWNHVESDGRTCSTHGGGKKWVRNLSRTTWRVETIGWIILQWTVKECDVNVSQSQLYYGGPGLFERGKIQKSELQTTCITLSFEQSSSFRRWTSVSWKFWPSQRALSIFLDPGRRLSSFWSSVGKCPVWCYTPICTWVFLAIF